MTPEERNMLQRALKLAEDNNELLAKINRRAHWAQVMQIFYWLIIIGISVGAYYFIQPYVAWMITQLNTLSGGSTSSGSEAISALVKLFQK